jgi:hypothetical protein
VPHAEAAWRVRDFHADDQAHPHPEVVAEFEQDIQDYARV